MTRRDRIIRRRDPIDLGIGLGELFGGGEILGGLFGGGEAAAATAGVGAEALGAGEVGADVALGTGADVLGAGATDAALGAVAPDVVGGVAAPAVAPEVTGGALTGAGFGGVEGGAAAGATTLGADIAPAAVDAGEGTLGGGAAVDSVLSPGSAFTGPGGFETIVVPEQGIDAALGPGGAPLDTGGVQRAIASGEDLGQGAGLAAGEGGAAGDVTTGSISGASGGLSSPSSPAAAQGGGFVDNALKYGKLGALGLGIAGIGSSLLKGNKLPKQDRSLEGISNTETGIGKQYLEMARRNEITPQMQAQIDLYKQQATNRAYQLYAQGSRDPNTSSDFQQTLAYINQQADIMHQQFVDQLFNEGMKAAGGASVSLHQLAQDQIRSDEGLSTAITNAAKAFGGGGTVIKI